MIRRGFLSSRASRAFRSQAGWEKRPEHLAQHLGQGVGGLLNATFGNAAELINALFALSKGLEGVVKASITGSIIGNLLPVSGLSLVFCIRLFDSIRIP